MIDASEHAGEESPGLHIDSDWKAQAQAEKQRLAAQDRTAGRAGAGAGAPGAPTGGAGELPPADFPTLVNMLATQAAMGLGAVADPQGRGVMIDLEGARFSIDMLALLEAKTQGNLTAEEKSELTQILGELRTRYVQVTRLLAEQMSKAGGAGVIQP
ncbi:MAG: DUF1844 domain-containing protein [Phycisphaeraceae bacterium]|nr:DUF1844 domain-containing protein [Phycisphaeraceae bacterium]